MSGSNQSALVTPEKPIQQVSWSSPCSVGYCGLIRICDDEFLRENGVIRRVPLQQVHVPGGQPAHGASLTDLQASTANTAAQLVLSAAQEPATAAAETVSASAAAAGPVSASEALSLQAMQQPVQWPATGMSCIPAYSKKVRHSKGLHSMEGILAAANTSY